MKTTSTLFVVLFLYAGAWPARAQGVSPGKVDVSFNAVLGGVDGQVTSLIAQPNGQVIVGGYSTLRLTRLNANGTRDNTFNNDVLGGHVNRLHPRSDGGYYVQGTFLGISGLVGYTNIALIRPDATHDTNFIARNFGGLPSSSQGVVLPDNRLLVQLASNQLAVVAADGVAGTPFAAADLTSITHFTVNSNGQIYVAGSRGALPALVRLNSDGSTDNLFMEPVFTNNFGTSLFFRHLVVQPDGRLLIVGRFTHVNGVQRGGLARLNTNGELDSTFVPGAGGIGSIYKGQMIPLNNATLLPDGRIILTRDGPFHYSNVFRAGVARLSPSGVLDTGFDPGTGPAGPFFSDSPSGWGIIAAAAGLNGEVYVGGVFTNFNGTGRRYVARLNPGPVSSTPTIVSAPQSQSVSNGADVVFSVGATGPGPLSYVWRHNNKVIPGATNSSLMLTNVQLANVGAYIVTVLNSAGSAAAAPAILTVNGVSVPDITKPAFTVTSPRGTFIRAISNQFTFSGTSRDNLGLGAICYQQDTNPWTQIVLTTNWNFTVNLNPGTNRFLVKVTDIAGNNSTTQKVTAFYVVTQALELKITGDGKVAGATTNQGLEIGRNYTLKATPKPGNLFSNWIDNGMVVTNPSLTFFMWSNSAVCANFVTNPFIALGGTYQGIFEDWTQFSHVSSGFISFLLSSRGSYSGRLHLAGAAFPLAGAFGLDLASTKVIPRRGTTDVLVAMQLNLATDSLMGYVSNALFFSFIGGYHALPPASNFVGRYTAVFATGDEPGDTPPAPGYATFNLARSGMLAMSGRLSDDTLFTQSVRARSNGDFVIYPAVYGGKGSFVGGFGRSDIFVPQADPYGLLLWNKLPGAPGALYQTGFGGMRLAIGSPYMAPARGATALTVTNLDLTLSGDGLTNDLVIPVSLGPNHRFTVNGTNTHRLTLTITPTTGAVSGSFTHPVTGRVAPIKAVLLKNQDAGAGYFVSTNGTGTVLLGTPDLD